MSSPAPRTAAPTLQDVARAAGVSLATASRVLNGSTRVVAHSYRERVAAAARELGYTANLSAQATARGTSTVVTLLVADIADPYFGQIAAGVSNAATREGLVMSIGVTGRDPEREADVVRALRGQRPRALILAASRVGDRLHTNLRRELDALSATGGKVVVLGAGGEELSSVPIDNVAGGRALGRAVAELGYRRAIVLRAQDGIRTSDDRATGFTAGFDEGGGEVSATHRVDFTRDSGEQTVARLLSDGISPGTMLFAISDVIAIGAMAAIRSAGLEVGADVAIAGFDDIPQARDLTPGLTTVRVPLDEVGERALRLALGDTGESAPLTLEVVLRGSTPALR